MSDPFTLDSNERATPLWGKLSGYLKARIAKLRARNDGPLSADETALVRAEIKALKGLLALGEELPIVPTAEETWPTATRARQ